MFNGNANLVRVAVSFWTGQVTLSRAEMDTAKGQKLPIHGKLLDLIDPALFVPFKTIKSRQIRACRKYAIKYGEDWLVSRNYFDKLEEELVAVKNDWNNAVVDFVNAYVDNMKEWRTKYPGSVMRAMQVSPNNMHERFHFGWTALQFIPADTLYNEQGNETIQMLGELSKDTLDNMLARASNLYDESFKGKTPSPKAWDAIGNLARDCRIFYFANSQLLRMAGLYEALLASQNTELAARLLTITHAELDEYLFLFEKQGLAAWEFPMPVDEPQPVTTDDLLMQAAKLLKEM